MGKTSIEWTRGDDGTPGATWNPGRGCSRVSPGCDNCYAMKLAYRFKGKGSSYEGLATLRNGKPDWTGVVREISEALDAPLRWRRPSRVFVNSQTDLFHPGFSNEFIAAVFGVMAACPEHTFQILTKRAERLPEWFKWLGKECHFANAGRGCTEVFRCLVEAQRASEHRALRNTDAVLAAPWPLPGVWLGVSAEDQQRADERIPHLLATPAAVRFISAEPLLGPISFRDHDWTIKDYLRGVETLQGSSRPLPSKIDWVIAGAESGNGARPMDEAWVRSIRDQCAEAGVSFFYKQRLDQKGHKVGLPMLDGVQHAAFPVSPP